MGQTTSQWRNHNVAIRTIKKRNMSPMVDRYKEIFGHPPSLEAYKYRTREEREKMASDAIKACEPIPEWRDRPKARYGTILDKLYERE